MKDQVTYYDASDDGRLNHRYESSYEGWHRHDGCQKRSWKQQFGKVSQSIMDRFIRPEAKILNLRTVSKGSIDNIVMMLFDLT